MLKKEFIKKNKWYLISLVLTIGVYFITRLINLLIIPIFTDEAIYLRWAQIALTDPRWRFISLIDGKQPLLIWLFLPALKLITDPLVAGRMVSIFSGFIALLGLMTFGWWITRTWKGIVIAGLLYILLPIFYVYDRLAIYEALLGAITIWTLFLTYIFAKNLRLDTALILGSVIGAGLLTKSSALYFILLLPMTLFIIVWKRSTTNHTIARWLGLSLVIVVQSQIYENILRLSEFRHYVGQKNLQFLYSFSEIISDPFKSVGGNLVGLSIWLVTYLTIPFTCLIIISLVWFVRKNWREGIFFLAYFIVPFLSLAEFGKVIYPRYLHFMIFPLLIPVISFVVHIVHIYRIKILFLVFIIIVLPMVHFNYKLAYDPIRAPLPMADRQQFINDWPAGYGISEIVDYFEIESQKGKIIVGTEGTFGLFPMALELYLGKNVNVTFKPFWPLNEMPSELIEDSKKFPTYLVFKERQTIPSDWPLQLVKEYQRGDGPTYLKLFRVLPKS